MGNAIKPSNQAWIRTHHTRPTWLANGIVTLVSTGKFDAAVIPMRWNGERLKDIVFNRMVPELNL